MMWIFCCSMSRWQNLDPATGKRAIDLIDKISKTTGKTVLIIEHRLEDALYRDVDRIVVVGEGEIVADMKPDELLCTDVLEKEGIREPLYITALEACGLYREAGNDCRSILNRWNLPLTEKGCRDGSRRRSCLRKDSGRSPCSRWRG